MRTIHTIGHSTRPIEEFIGLLQSHGVDLLVDIRTIPKSRHNPQYQQENLESSLREAGIEYVYLKDLGGLRPATENSVNAGWRNRSFRNYADYMQTEAFSRGVGELLELAEKKTAAIMCAEAVPWRCHRSLVGDALLVRGVEVLDIISGADPKPHRLTPFAVVKGTEITYPSPEGEAGKQLDILGL